MGGAARSDSFTSYTGLPEEGGAGRALVSSTKDTNGSWGMMERDPPLSRRFSSFVLYPEGPNSSCGHTQFCDGHHIPLLFPVSSEAHCHVGQMSSVFWLFPDLVEAEV